MEGTIKSGNTDLSPMQRAPEPDTRVLLEITIPRCGGADRTMYLETVCGCGRLLGNVLYKERNALVEAWVACRALRVPVDADQMDLRRSVTVRSVEGAWSIETRIGDLEYQTRTVEGMDRWVATIDIIFDLVDKRGCVPGSDLEVELTGLSKL
jgi:hypothetical protein